MSPPSARSSKRQQAISVPEGRSSSGGGNSRSRNRPTNPSRGKRNIDHVNEEDSQPGCPSGTTAGDADAGSIAPHNQSQSKKRLAAERSIAGLLSSQASRTDESDSSEEPRSGKRRSIRPYSISRADPEHRPHPPDDLRSVTPTLYAKMYQFKTKQASTAQQNGVIDLTKPAVSRNGMYNGVGKNSFNSNQGPKKIVVKSLKPGLAHRNDKMEMLEQKWKGLDAALERLFEGKDNKLLFEELYSSSEYLCRQGLSKELYSRLKTKCTGHLDGRLRKNLRDQADSLPATATLQAFVNTWTLWQHELKNIRNVFFYLNQTHLVRSTEDPVLEVLGLQLFRSVVFQDDRIRDQTLHGTVELVNRDRIGNGDVDGQGLAKQAVATLYELGVYNTDFEPLFERETQNYFESWRTSEAERADLAHYIKSCTTLFEQELARCDVLGMGMTTKAIIAEQFDQIMIEENVERLTQEDALLDLFEANMADALKQAYFLLQRKIHQHLLGPAFARFIETEGSLIVFDEKRDAEMVVRLLDFRKKLAHICRYSFDKNEQLDNTLHKSFEIFMNKTKKLQSTWNTDNAKPGEMIAKHVDLLLKGGPKAVPGLRKEDKNEEEHDFDDEGNADKEVEQHLDDALDLFRFVQGKAVFEAFYKKDLARRLLMGRTQSFDAERSMLTRLRNECGAGFTHNLESMFKDMDLAREEMKSYNQLLSDRGTKLSPDLSVNVLSIAAWPTYPDVPVNLPPAVSKAQADFERHYKEKHVGRRLHWKPTLSHCQLKANFPKAKKEIVVSGFQAVVLLLFNDVADDESLTYDQIGTATALPSEELVRTLQSLACGKYRVLSKTPRGRDINPTDTFTFNRSFTDPKYRIKINQIQLKETKEENKETHQRVAADRHYETQAAIVRIMKSRKVIGHNDLIVEVIKATRSRGVLDQNDIKRNIEKLIEKEYMERDDDVKNGYKYLA